MRITTEEQLRAVIGEPTTLVASKIADRLNVLTRPFIERSPFVCVATSNTTGDCDVSPLGAVCGDPTFDVQAYDEARNERYARREGFY